jgi:cytidine deaminase
MTTQLITAAWAVRERAYAPYSKFHVGAAILTTTGEIYTGCNVENLSYGLTNCAERVALGSMIAAGQREIAQVVVVADTDQPISPCGACRQVMAEFGDFPILMVCQHSQLEMKLSQLLPRASTGILNKA